LAEELKSEPQLAAYLFQENREWHTAYLEITDDKRRDAMCQALMRRINAAEKYQTPKAEMAEAIQELLYLNRRPRPSNTAATGPDDGFSEHDTEKALKKVSRPPANANRKQRAREVAGEQFPQKGLMAISVSYSKDDIETLLSDEQKSMADVYKFLGRRVV